MLISISGGGMFKFGRASMWNATTQSLVI